MNNSLLYIGGLLIVAFAALFAVPFAIDWNSYRGVFEEEASRLLGREVRVSGDVGLRLLPSPYVHLEKIRIGGALGEETGRALFRAERFMMWLSVPPLLKGVVEAKEVELRKPVLEISIDAEGRTNLSALKLNPGRISFVPHDVALQSVRLTDGSLGVTGPNGVELARLEAVNGEVSADTIEGPFRFRGSLDWEGERREVRLNTARRDANGDLRFKALVTVPKNANSFTLDATASDLAGSVKINGALAARISTRGFEVSAAEDEASKAAPAPASAGSGAGFFELTSKLSSDRGRVALDDIAISLEQGGLPQLISGRSSIGWHDRLMLDVELTSKWLDLDLLTAHATDAPGAVPLELARTLFDRLVDELPASADTNIALSIEQVGLGQQAVSGLRLRASRSGGPLELKDVRVSLPGGTHLALDGVLDGEAGGRSFKGTMALSGQSLTRFSKWGFGDNPFGGARSDGPFSIAGNLMLNDKGIELTEAAAEVSGTPVIGEVKLGLEAPRRLAVALEGQRIDLDDLWPDNPGLDGLRGLLTGGGPAEGETEAPGLFGADVAFDIKAGELIDGARKLQNVHLDVTLQKGALTVPRLKFASAGGLLVDLEGAAVDVPKKTHGQLRGVIEAPTPEAVTTLSDLMALPDDIDAKVERWSRLAPWRVGATFSFGERAEEAVDVSIDGTLRGGRAVAEARIDAGRGDWRRAAADFTARIDTPDVYGFLDMISGTRSKEGTSEPRPGKVFVKAAGKAADGLVAVAELDAETVQLEFNGRVHVPETSLLAAKGEIRVDAQDLSRVMALTGLALGPGAGSIPVKGTIAAAHDGARLTLASPALRIGEAAVSGVLTFSAGVDGQPASVEADLSADKASLPTLIAALTATPPLAAEAPIELPAAAPRRRKAEAEETPPAPATSPWPEQAFDLKPLDGIAGTLKAGIRSLSLEPDLAMKDARLELAFAPGKAEVRKLEGAVLGGKAVSAFTIEKQPAGVALTGNLQISISSKGSAESGADETIEGDVAALAVTFDGRALSPAAMIGAMTGKGQLTLGDVALSGVAPKAVADVADQMLQGKSANVGAALQTALPPALKAAQLKLGKVTIPVTIADGTMRLDRVRVDTPEGRATFDTMLDLKTFVVDSTWRIEGRGLTRAAPSVPGAAARLPGEASVPAPVEVKRSLLPPVNVVYAGRLADLGTMEPMIETEALERELTVRRMERDVDELERLRKLDQLRAKQERERQDALEAERQRRQRELEERLAPSGAAPQLAPGGAPGPQSLPAEGAATVPPAEANAASDANPLPENVPETEDATMPERRRVQTQTQTPIRKKPPAGSWQPFQISPYQ